MMWPVLHGLITAMAVALFVHEPDPFNAGLVVWCGLCFIVSLTFAARS